MNMAHVQSEIVFIYNIKQIQHYFFFYHYEWIFFFSIQALCDIILSEIQQQYKHNLLYKCHHHYIYHITNNMDIYHTLTKIYINNDNHYFFFTIINMDFFLLPH